MPDYLDAYNTVEGTGKSGFVLSDEAGAVMAALAGVAGGGVGEAAGRGQIVRFPLHAGEGVLRRFRRGGLVARIFGDRYLFNRMAKEFHVMARLHAAGAPVPQPLGVIWARRGLFYRGALVTRAVDGVTLLAYLQGGAVDPGVLRQCGRAIRAIHDRGVWHADLQVKNILIGGDTVWIIDFDNARSGRPPSDLARARNLLRFRRSLDKHGQSLDNFDTIREGYGKLGLPWWLSALYRFRGTVSDALQK